MPILHKHYTILYKGVEHLQILVSVTVPRINPNYILKGSRRVPWWDLKGQGSPAPLQYWKWADRSVQNTVLHKGYISWWETETFWKQPTMFMNTKNKNKTKKEKFCEVRRFILKLGMMKHTCNCSSWEAERGLGNWGQPETHSETLPQKKYNTKSKNKMKTGSDNYTRKNMPGKFWKEQHKYN
jgi:hypothetical protein